MFYLVETQTGKNIYPAEHTHCHFNKETKTYVVSGIGDDVFASTKTRPIVASDLHDAMAWLTA